MLFPFTPLTRGCFPVYCPMSGEIKVTAISGKEKEEWFRHLSELPMSRKFLIVRWIYPPVFRFEKVEERKLYRRFSPYHPAQLFIYRTIVESPDWAKYRDAGIQLDAFRLLNEILLAKHASAIWEGITGDVFARQSLIGLAKDYATTLWFHLFTGLHGLVNWKSYTLPTASRIAYGVWGDEIKVARLLLEKSPETASNFQRIWTDLQEMFNPNPYVWRKIKPTTDTLKKYRELILNVWREYMLKALNIKKPEDYLTSFADKAAKIIADAEKITIPEARDKLFTSLSALSVELAPTDKELLLTHFEKHKEVVNTLVKMLNILVKLRKDYEKKIDDIANFVYGNIGSLAVVPTNTGLYTSWSPVTGKRIAKAGWWDSNIASIFDGELQTRYIIFVMNNMLNNYHALLSDISVLEKTLGSVHLIVILIALALIAITVGGICYWKYLDATTAKAARAVEESLSKQIEETTTKLQGVIAEERYYTRAKQILEVVRRRLKEEQELGKTVRTPLPEEVKVLYQKKPEVFTNPWLLANLPEREFQKIIVPVVYAISSDELKTWYNILSKSKINERLKAVKERQKTVETELVKLREKAIQASRERAEIEKRLAEAKKPEWERIMKSILLIGGVGIGGLITLEIIKRLPKEKT